MDPLRGNYLGTTTLAGTRRYADHLIAHTVMIEEYERMLLVRSASTDLDPAGMAPIAPDRLDAIETSFMCDVVTGLRTHDGRGHQLSFYRGATGAPHGLSVIVAHRGTGVEYVGAIQRQVRFLDHVSE